MSKECVEAGVLLMRRRIVWYSGPYMEGPHLPRARVTRSNLLAHVVVAHDVRGRLSLQGRHRRRIELKGTPESACVCYFLWPILAVEDAASWEQSSRCRREQSFFVFRKLLLYFHPVLNRSRSENGKQAYSPRDTRSTGRRLHKQLCCCSESRL